MERIGGEQEGEGEVGEMESSADDSSNALQCFSLLYSIVFLFSLLCIRLSAVQFTLNCSLQKCAVFFPSVVCLRHFTLGLGEWGSMQSIQLGAVQWGVSEGDMPLTLYTL